VRASSRWLRSASKVSTGTPTTTTASSSQITTPASAGRGTAPRRLGAQAAVAPRRPGPAAPQRGQLHLVGAAASDQAGPQQSTKGIAAQLGPVDPPTLRGAVEQRGELRVGERWKTRGSKCGEVVVATARRATTAVAHRHTNDAAPSADAHI
jgi:hypothetical protein